MNQLEEAYQEYYAKRPTSLVAAQKARKALGLSLLPESPQTSSTALTGPINTKPESLYARVKRELGDLTGM